MVLVTVPLFVRSLRSSRFHNMLVTSVTSVEKQLSREMPSESGVVLLVVLPLLVELGNQTPAQPKLLKPTWPELRS